jgi:hypothetical protein
VHREFGKDDGIDTGGRRVQSFPPVGGREPGYRSPLSAISRWGVPATGASGTSVGATAGVMTRVVPEVGRPGREIRMRDPLRSATPKPPATRWMPLLDAARRDTP